MELHEIGATAHPQTFETGGGPSLELLPPGSADGIQRVAGAVNAVVARLGAKSDQGSERPSVTMSG